MAGIVPIPTTRISGLLARQRLTQQYQTDQLDLFRLQEQISTGYRISLPSEDAPAAIRAISIQRLLSRKTQLDTNINRGMVFLGATDTAVNDVASKLNEVKSITLGAIDSTATDKEREEAIIEINKALESLVNEYANKESNDRYLFAGSQTDEIPYSITEDGYVVYHGDDKEIRSFSDLGVLFSSNATGQEVFGGISEPVEGSVDLNPQLTEDTLLSSLNGGRGINPNGSLQITNVAAVPNQTSIIDISNASTVGDVIRLIESNPPAGNTVDVSISDNGLEISLDSGTLIISEVGTGTTVRELGLSTDSNFAANIVAGEDLNPVLLKTTPLEDLLGTRARATLSSSNSNNDILIEANQNGTNLDGVTINVVDGTGIGSSPTVNLVGSTLTITVDDAGDTTANDIIDAINNDPLVPFTASLDLVDSASTSEAGTGAVIGGISSVTTGGSGEVLDQTSGIRVVNGGNTYDINFGGAETVEDVLNILNASEAQLQAEISDNGSGINIRSRLSGSDFQIGEVNGGTTATQLGVRTYGVDTELSEFNFGVGVPTSEGFELPTVDGDDLTIQTIDGQTFTVDLSAATSITDVVDSINAATGAAVTASEVITGNVSTIQLVDNSLGGTDSFRITQAEGSLAGQYLGLVPNGVTTATSAGNTLTGDDAEYTDLSITAKDGQTFNVDLSSATTVGDVIDAINTATGGVLVEARIARSGNGIEIEDNTGGTDPLTVTAVGSSQAAEYLGLADEQEDGTFSRSSTSDVLTGDDRHYLENESVFNTLIRLRDALEANDLPAISRAAEQIDVDIQRVTFAQADVGARYQGLELTQYNLEDEVVQLQAALSEEIDVDLVQAISDLTARQISLQASLQTTASILQLSLLNFI